jgi:hypothetical protein
MDYSVKLLLLAAGWTVIALPTALGQGSTPHQAQAVAAQAPVTQTQKVPQWQTAAGGKMSFEVASIRLSKPGTFTLPSFPLSRDDSYTPTAGLFRADFPLMVYVEFAYKLWLTREQRESILAHRPKWVATDNFEIHARASGNPTKDQMRLMMQSLLADRFKLAIHFETQQVPVLALVLVKPGVTGPKLRPHANTGDAVLMFPAPSLLLKRVSTETRCYSDRHVWRDSHPPRQTERERLSARTGAVHRG